MFKSIVDLAEVLIVNEQVTVDSWNLANNNTGTSICLPDNMKAVVNNTVKNVIETNSEEIPIPMLEDEKPEIKPIKEETNMSLNYILTNNSPEDMYIKDNYISEIKPEK